MRRFFCHHFHRPAAALESLLRRNHHTHGKCHRRHATHFYQNVTPAVCGASVGGIDLSVSPTGGNNFIWSNGSASEDVQNLPPGSYDVTVTASNGCSTTGSFDVPNTIGQPVSGVAITCQTTANASAPGASDGSGSVSMQGGTAPYLISWTPGGVGNQPVSGGNFNLNNLTEGNYSVSVTDANGCPENCAFTISSGTQPCVTAVGTMQTATLSACGNDCISVNYNTVGQILENGDLLQFILHQGNANQIVTGRCFGFPTVTSSARATR